MCRPPILTSRNIGLAENALRALLNKALQHTGLDYHRWVALKLVADGQWPIPVATLIGQLKDFLKMDEAERARGHRRPSRRGTGRYRRSDLDDAARPVTVRAAV